MTATWEYPSSSDASKIYVVTHAENGLLGCTCRGWTMKRPGKARECRHITDIITKLGLVREIRGEYVFAAHSLTGAAPAQIIVDDPVAFPLTPAPDGNIITSDMATMAATATQGMNAPAAQLASGMTKPLIGDAFNKFYGDGTWTMDEKLDGHRCVVVKRGEKVVGWSRGGDKANSKALPQQIVDAIQQMPDGIYDGELMVPGGNAWNVTELTNQGQLTLILFDILEVLGENVTGQPHSMRRQLLATAISPVTSSAVLLVAEFTPEWAVIEKIWASGGEGVILKKLSASYRPGYRSDAWVKVKQLESHAVTVTGFEAGSLGPTAVTLFRFDDGVEGRCKTLNNAELAATAANPAAYIGRRLVIQCQQRINGKSPRHPMFDHWAGEAE